MSFGCYHSTADGEPEEMLESAHPVALSSWNANVMAINKGVNNPTHAKILAHCKKIELGASPQDPPRKDDPRVVLART